MLFALRGAKSFLLSSSSSVSPSSYSSSRSLKIRFRGAALRVSKNESSGEKSTFSSSSSSMMMMTTATNAREALDDNEQSSNSATTTTTTMTNPRAFHNARSMDFRDWLSVERCMLAIVREERQLSDLNERLKDAEPDLPVHYSLAKTLEETKDAKQRSHRQLTESKRAKYCVRLKYFGNAFASFAWDKNVDDVSKHSRDRFYGEKWTPGNASVVATIRESLGEHCAGFDKEKHPVVYQSGRTDRNVSGAGQIVQIFRDPKDHLERRYVDEREEKEKCELIRRAINESTEVGKRGYLKAVECFRVNSEWHATFSATWRRYVYVVPKRTLNVEEVKEELRKVEGGEIDAEDLDMFTQYSEDEIDCDLLDRMLRKFEGKTIDFNAFARDTAKGKSTECTMLYARARRITIPKFQMNAETRTYGKRYRDRRFKDTSLLFDDPTFLSANAAKKEDDEEEPLECIAIELVADRFLRKMVRCIVSTACREAMLSNPNRTTDHQREEEAKEFNENVLLDLARNGDRTALAPPAPPYGLLFCGVGYGNKSFEDFVARD